MVIRLPHPHRVLHRTRTDAELQSALSKIEALEKGGSTASSGETGEELQRLLLAKETALSAALGDSAAADARCKALEKSISDSEGKIKSLKEKLSDRDNEISTLKKAGGGGDAGKPKWTQSICQYISC
jgi:hypothetical protein